VSFFSQLVRLTVCCALAAGCLPAQTGKGNRFLAEGRVHEAKKEWDDAVECYRKAQVEDPTDPVYQIAFEKGRAQAAQWHVEQGLAIRARGELGQALAEFQKAYALHPGSIIALQEMEETQQMIARERKRIEETGKESPPEVRALTPGEAADREEDRKIGRMLPVPELRPAQPGKVDLKLTGKARTVFEAVAKAGGFNLLWDPEYVPPAHDDFTVDLKNATPDEAFDSLASMTKANWKRLSPGVIFVTNAYPAK
jgi:tetratricopeptide (TPR) repeat protein